MGNGQKAQQKRERNAKMAKANTNTSQLKANAAAKSIICQTCRQTFLCTVREKAFTFSFLSLAEHAENKHSKTTAECFPGFVEMSK
ncbi:DUF1909-domain-containing protein [Basidiobolus meristosporus CBS 931.73]|uniref:DUF1909-domain-containing protein n=1 Tax=Basidiobolus meristosporus CBS 931.73 TaxID=1314790 RepID=A0A1Y1Z7H8_9FUNG|nr:DUF1909-domain-containing protein [Basidiobolus meristosporus CBS 931.73]|eukprot:ORY05765.1 DUF1909-domain-containing protein [Basidiobolus meristosporus CBS 931.73]